MSLFKKENIDKAVEIGEKIGDSKNEKWDRLNALLDREEEDRQEARELFAASSKKIIHYLVSGAIIYGFIYTLHILLPAIVNGNLKEIDPLPAATLGTLVTLIATNMQTIRDFLFGSSDSDKDAAQSLTEANNPANRAKQRHERKMARIQNRKD